jgi:hypothetical protein
VVLQRAKEKFPHETPRIISDNGSQFLAGQVKELEFVGEIESGLPWRFLFR